VEQCNLRVFGVDAVVQIAQLDMAEDVLPTSARSPAASNRYIYYPDHLVRMPGPLPGVNLLTNVVRNFMNVLQEPIFKGSLLGLIKEGRIDVRPGSMKDESVGDFVTRRFGRHVADNLVSALLHGIYAGDLYKLSAKTILPLFWHLEKISEVGIVGELVEQMWSGESLLPYDDIEFTLQSDQAISLPEAPVNALAEKLEGSSVYTFKKGLAQLAEKIESGLRGNSNVEIRNITASVAYDAKTSSFNIKDANGRESKSKENSNQYDYVVATISPLQLSKALQPQDSASSASPSSPFAEMLSGLHSSTSFVNVVVVNLFYRNPDLLPVSGFGYLLPRSIPIEQNPERALGVIFGSETSGGSSHVPSEVNRTGTGQDSAAGTKLTVMMGGHWWSSWSHSDLPDEESAIEMARAVLERHLRITDAPIVAKARMQWNAIPQYEVGHHERMARIHQHLRTEFDGRLKVAGSAYQGVGVNDCVKAARRATFDIREGFDTRTGLENFGQNVRWAVYKKRERAVYMHAKNGGGFAGRA
jgi:protoporphyrinogen/coproporphyrinogen III oxidase